jgi:hypothetical protein
MPRKKKPVIINYTPVTPVKQVIQEITTEEEIRQKMAAGYELVNRGTGWYLSRTEAYKNHPLFRVSDDFVEELKKQKRIRFVDTTYSCKVEFVCPPTP